MKTGVNSSYTLLNVNLLAFFATYIRPAIAGGAMYFAVYAVGESLSSYGVNLWVQLFAMVLAGAFVYGAILWLVFKEQCLEALDMVRSRV